MIEDDNDNDNCDDHHLKLLSSLAIITFITIQRLKIYSQYSSCIIVVGDSLTIWRVSNLHYWIGPIILRNRCDIRPQ